MQWYVEDAADLDATCVDAIPLIVAGFDVDVTAGHHEDVCGECHKFNCAAVVTAYVAKVFAQQNGLGASCYKLGKVDAFAYCVALLCIGAAHFYAVVAGEDAAALDVTVDQRDDHILNASAIVDELLLESVFKDVALVEQGCN